MSSIQSPRVLFLNSCIHGGGAGNSLAAYLKQESHHIDAHVVMPERGILAQQIESTATLWFVPEFVERIQRCPYHWLQTIASPALHLIANWWAVPTAIARIAKIARAIQPHVIYCNHMLAEPIGVAVGALTGIPVIIHARNFHMTAFGRIFYRFLGTRKNVKAIIANSVATSLPYQSSCAEKTYVVYNFLNVNHFKRSQIKPILRRRFDIPNDALVFGYMGRFVKWKGVELMLHAFAKVFAQLPSAHLVLLGETDSGSHDDLKAKYEQMATKLGIATGTHFAPFATDIRPIASDFDVLVLPSIYPEPFGRVLIEAMSLGLPCIVAAHGGAIEIVQYGQQGLWFEPNNPIDLAQQMMTLATDSSMRLRLSANALARAQQHFDSADLAGRITSIIHTIATNQSFKQNESSISQGTLKFVREFAENPSKALTIYRSTKH